MLLKAETAIEPNEDAVELGARLAPMGAKLLIETLTTSPTPQAQDPAEATLAPILKKEDGLIDWKLPALRIHNLIRGLQPWPGGYTTFRGALLQIWKARVSEETTAAAPGQILKGSKPLISCGEGTVLEALEVQQEGRKRIPASAFWNGLRLTDNEALGVTSL
jgi:methionyl-tRNA formyltransferase